MESYFADCIEEIGIDFEETSVFTEKCNSEEFFNGIKSHIVTKKEPSPQTPMELLELWTKKESLFKQNPKKSFNPLKIQITEDVSSFKFAHENSEFLCSVSGSDVKKSFFYFYNGEEASKIKDILWT